MNDWHVYLVRCSDGSLYCGITRDLEKRLAQHNGRKPGGARYTRSRRPVNLIASLANLEHGQALRYEAKIKKLRQNAKIAAFSQNALS